MSTTLGVREKEKKSEGESMKKKKISLKLVTLVMSGTLLAAPMVSSAEEAGNNSITSSTNPLESTGETSSTATASESTTGTGGNASTTAAVGNRQHCRNRSGNARRSVDHTSE